MAGPAKTAFPFASRAGPFEGSMLYILTGILATVTFWLVVRLCRASRGAEMIITGSPPICTITLFRDLYGGPPIAAKSSGRWYAVIPEAVGLPADFAGRWALVIGGCSLERQREVGRLVPCGEISIQEAE